MFQARNDKDAIAAWKSDLGRILQVFNVRSVIFSRPSLTVPFQTELALNTHVTVSEMRYDVSGIRHDVLGIRGDVSKIREEIGGNVRSVSASRVHTINNERILTVA